MTNSKDLRNKAVRALVAAATTILTGAGAGVALARKPLVVTCDDRTPVARRRS